MVTWSQQFGRKLMQLIALLAKLRGISDLVSVHQ